MSSTGLSNTILTLSTLLMVHCSGQGSSGAPVLCAVPPPWPQLPHQLPWIANRLLSSLLLSTNDATGRLRASQAFALGGKIRGPCTQLPDIAGISRLIACARCSIALCTKQYPDLKFCHLVVVPPPHSLGLNCHVINHPLKVTKGDSGQLRSFGPEPSLTLSCHSVSRFPPQTDFRCLFFQMKGAEPNPNNGVNAV